MRTLKAILAVSIIAAGSFLYVALFENLAVAALVYVAFTAITAAILLKVRVISRLEAV